MNVSLTAKTRRFTGKALSAPATSETEVKRTMMSTISRALPPCDEPRPAPPPLA